MPVDRLTKPPPGQLAAGVRAILAGTDPTTIATELGITPTDLHDAVNVYHHGGVTALNQLLERDWYDVRVEFPDWTAAETIGATHLGPALDTLHTQGAHSGWWFLRKHPCWRVRLHRADTTAVDHVLDGLITAGHLTRWRKTIYEPETAAFGGPASMAIIHDLFCADTHGTLNLFRHHQPSLGRRELSILLLTALFRSAGLDTFERGDVFHRVTQLRPTPPETNQGKIDHLATVLHPILILDDPSRTDLFDHTGPAAHTTTWLAELRHAGHQLAETAHLGQLGRGLRAILSHVVIFHWNRLGLPALTQAILARAATTALLPQQ